MRIWFLTLCLAACAQPVRVMPLGDSLTDGLTSPGSYRISFVAAAQKAKWPFAFVGSLENGPPDFLERHHEGHNGWRIRQIDQMVDPWLTQSRPQLVLLMIGSNDVLMQDDLAHAPERLRLLLTHLAARAHVIVSTVPPIGDPERQIAIDRFNAAIPEVVRQVAGVRFVDLGALIHTGDLVDGVHLSADANRRLGEAWFHAAREGG